MSTLTMNHLDTYFAGDKFIGHTLQDAVNWATQHPLEWKRTTIYCDIGQGEERWALPLVDVDADVRDEINAIEDAALAQTDKGTWSR